MSLFYTGVGSRSTPDDVQSEMISLASDLRRAGYVLRSGAAAGADSAFEIGAGDAKAIFVPWPGFRGKRSVVYPEVSAMRMASEIHPKWGALATGAKLLHARNCFQVLGADLKTPSMFVVCWTPCGAEREADCCKETGGTATAIRLASRHSVPVFNLKRADAMARLLSFLEL